jgi:hypothetical protein
VSVLVLGLLRFCGFGPVCRGVWVVLPVGD